MPDLTPTERRKRAAQIADELNADPILCGDIKFLLDAGTAAALTKEDTPSPGSYNLHRPQFHAKSPLGFGWA